MKKRTPTDLYQKNNDIRSDTHTPSAFAPIFKEQFYDKMLKPNGNNPVRNRADGFMKIFELLDATAACTKYHILETGTMRADHGDMCFGDDGVSTYIFDKFCEHKRFAELTSVDIDEKNCVYARTKVSPRTTIVCADSVPFLYSIAPKRKFQLIYLDSFDIEKNNPLPSQIHHLHELLAVWKNTARHTIIAIDDNDAFFDGGVVGKGTLVKEYFSHIGIKPVFEGYQIVWQLP